MSASFYVARRSFFSPGAVGYLDPEHIVDVLSNQQIPIHSMQRSGGLVTVLTPHLEITAGDTFVSWSSSRPSPNLVSALCGWVLDSSGDEDVWLCNDSGGLMVAITHDDVREIVDKVESGWHYYSPDSPI